jgi:soluble lytic murein transglycosylase
MALTFIKRLAATAVVAALAAPCALRAQSSDADFLAAKEAAQRGQWKALEIYRARLAGHVLEAYPAYWLLSGTVERADPKEAQAFLARYPGSPLAESLRRELLKALGAAQSWELFRAEYPRMAGDDVEVTCYSFQERLARGDAEVAAEAHALFVSGRDSAAPCDTVFAALAAAGRITEAQTWTRFRVLAASGNLREAKRLTALLPARRAPHDKAIDRIARDPARFLAHEKVRQLDRAGQELVVFAIARLARAKPEEAAERLAAWTPRLPADAVAFSWGQVAWQGALAHHPSALEWYARAGDAKLDDSQVAWRARAALRAGDWKQVLDAIQALSAQEAREPTWRYWRARALRALGDAPGADALLRALAPERHFYGLLAAEEIGTAKAPDWSGGWRPAAADLERVRAFDGIQRALELYRLGLDTEAAREWLWAIRGFDDRDLLTAAEIARQARIAERAINTADRTVQLHDFAQRFPTPHRDALAAAARQWDLDEAIVYALVRQESRFNAEARSRVGAVGLMQLMPATARWVAKQIALAPFRPQMLSSPDLNAQMGAYYFRRVLTALGHPMLATAAYNAGPGRARRWRDERALEGAIYAETIPFGETRDYVKKVFANAWYYHHRLTGKVASLHEMLGVVPGASGDSDAVVANIP